MAAPRSIYRNRRSARNRPPATSRRNEEGNIEQPVSRTSRESIESDADRLSDEPSDEVESEEDR